MKEDDPTESTTTADPIAPAITFKKRSAKAKSNFRKKPTTPPPTTAASHNSDSDSGSDFASSEDEEGRRIKRRRKTAAVTASSASQNNNRADHQNEDSAGSRALLVANNTVNDATKSSNWYDEGANQDDLSAKNLLGKTRAGITPATSDDTYRGVANYQSFIQKNPNAPSKQVGPMKAPTNVRTITVTDFSPDVCKE
jgi:RING finger protein 113A